MPEKKTAKKKAQKCSVFMSLTYYQKKSMSENF